MVSQRLVEEARRLLGERPLRILVTGGTGFVGSHLARTLASAGHDVVALGRNAYRTSRIWHERITIARGDVRDASAVAAACAGCDFVFHAAALSSPWADRAVLQAINVEGTRNVVRGCQTHRVRRLVHVSSTAIHFNFADQPRVTEDTPLPARASCDYAQSKRDAEAVIRRAAGEGLNTFTIRARAVFGPGDSTLLPRLIAAARAGRLRQIGDGKNRVDLTYIDNLVYGLLLAATRGPAGGVCTITNDEPIKLWEFLPQLFTRLGIPYADKRVPYPLAYAAAALQEAVHAALPRLGEPKLTRYTAGLLAKEQVFDISAAKRELGYAPLLPLREGIERTIGALLARDEQPATARVRLRLFTTGHSLADRRFVERGAPSAKIKFHGLVALIEHPRFGLTLFDTGYAPRLLSEPGLSAAFYRRLVPPRTNAALSIAGQLSQAGIDPRDVRRVVISHFHPDHVAGVRDFPQADLVASQVAWESVRNRRGLWALQRGSLPGLLPDDFAQRVQLIEQFDEPGLGPFERSHDLFGDGSVRLFELPGHAAGQIGALVQQEGGAGSSADARTFLVADGSWTSEAIRRNLPPHAVTRLFIDSFGQLTHTLDKLHRFARQYPQIELVPSHCPEVAARNAFDETAARLLGGD